MKPYLTLRIALGLTIMVGFLVNPLWLPKAQATDYFYYVEQGGVDAGDCNSSDPCGSLSYVFDHITNTVGPGSGDLVEIHIDFGTYPTPNLTLNVDYTLFIIGLTPALTILDGGNSHPTLDINLASTGVFIIYNSTLQNGSGQFGLPGGGLRLIGTGSNLVFIDNSVFSNNHAPGGGGGMHLANVNANLTDVTISDNTSTTGGGAGFSVFGSDISFFDGEVARNSITNSGFRIGAGMYILASDFEMVRVYVHDNDITATGGAGAGMYLSGDMDTVLIANSVVSQNVIRADGNSASFDSASGAGIFCQAHITNPFLMLNTTVSHNRIEDLGELFVASGLGLSATGGCNFNLQHNTFVYNHVVISSPSVGYISRTLSLTTNGVLYNNLVGGTGDGLACFLTGSVTAIGNLDDDNSCTGFATVDDLGLAPLSVVAGYAWPMNPPWPYSPALNYTSANCLSGDARGVVRSTPCDLGAYEGFHYPAFLPVLRR